MKRWIGLLSVLLACVLICAGCGSEKVNVKGTFVPLDSEADPNSEYFEGGTYTNEYFGFVADLPKDICRIRNSDKYLSHEALFAYFMNGSYMGVHIYNIDQLEDMQDKSAKEFGIKYLEDICAGFEESELTKNTGDYYEIEFNFAGQNTILLAAKTTPTIDDGAAGATVYFVPFKKGEHFLGIVGIDIGAQSSEDIQNFLNEIFAALP